MEPLSADESARGAAYDALLLDLFSEISAADTSASNHSSSSTTGAPFDASDDDAFVDFQADLAAFDALMESPTQGDLAFDIAVSSVDDAPEPMVKHENAVYDGYTAAIPGVTTTAGVSSATGTAVVVKKKSAPGGNIARKRHREELRVLRESVVVLENELRNLRAKPNEASPFPSPPPHNNDSNSGQHALDTLSPDQKVPRRWSPQEQQQQQQHDLTVKLPSPVAPARPPTETLLARETHARQITELENMHLSKLVNDHQKVAQQFEKALLKESPPTASDLLETMPTSEQATGGFYLNKHLSAISVPHTPADSQAFDRLEKNVETRYHELERVFQAVGLSDCRTNLREASVDTDHEEGGVLLKFKSSRLVPFNVHVINETALKIARANIGKGHGIAHERDGKSVAFKKQFQAGGITINVRGVSKRYTENGRIVIVWDGISEWPSKVSGETVTIEEKGWGIIQPYQPPQSSSSAKSKANKKRKKEESENGLSPSASPLSLLQSYIYMTPGPAKNGGAKRKEPQPEHIAILSDVVMPLYTKLFAARIQHLENVLVEDSLKRRLTAS